jgi:hypothetical protein
MGCRRRGECLTLKQETDQKPSELQPVPCPVCHWLRQCLDGPAYGKVLPPVPPAAPSPPHSVRRNTKKLYCGGEGARRADEGVTSRRPLAGGLSLAFGPPAATTLPSFTNSSDLLLLRNPDAQSGVRATRHAVKAYGIAPMVVAEFQCFVRFHPSSGDFLLALLW